MPMTWRDRPYAGDDEPRPELRLSLGRPSTAVTWLIVVNVAAYFVDAISRNASPLFWGRTFGLSWDGLFSGRVWQPLTYMFVHGDLWHLVGNMLGLYVFGSEFERAFGRDRFLTFYAICGLVGGFAYVIISGLGLVPTYVPIVGASGSVYGLLIAAIIFFPHIQVIIVIFPMPVRVFGLIVLGFLLLRLVTPERLDNLGGEICHMGGAAAGVLTLYAWRMMPRLRLGSGEGLRRRIARGAWERRLRREAEEQREVDRILAKVSESGLQSLTRTERRTLQVATRRQQQREREIGRTDRV